MKSIVKFIAFFLFLSASIVYSSPVFAQQKDSVKNIQSRIENKQFIFVVTAVYPLRGQTRFITDPYDVTVRGDSVISYLPYFGVSQSAPISTDDAGIKFTSTNFTYTVEQGKKESIAVTVKFNDQRITNQFYFSINKNGNATLDVTSNSRDAISFRGYIK